MSILLHIETSTAVCSVALSCDSKLIYSETDTHGPSHAVQLGVFVDRALTYLEQQHGQLDAVAVSGGPGSYTGLRIGVSMAKGICYGKGIPLISVPTLRVLAQQAADILGPELPRETLLCPMLDARRMEVYTAVYDRDFTEVNLVQALVVDENSFADLSEDKPLYIFGNGADKVRSLIQRENIVCMEALYPRAEDMILPAEQAFRENRFEDTAYFEPFYLKEFQATVPRKMNQLIYHNNNK